MPSRKKPSTRNRILNDRRLREKVFAQIAAPDAQARPTIADMDLYIVWLKTGKLPGKTGLHLVTPDRPLIDRGQ